MPTDEDIERVMNEAIAQGEARAAKAAGVKPDPLDLPDITSNFIAHPAKLVREYVRSVLAPELLRRMYRTAMGIEKFDTPTAIGRVVQVEAPPAVQMATARALIQVGIPMQLGISDSDGNALPGVIALGPLDLDAARAESHGERYVSPETQARLVAQHQAQGPLAGNGNGNGNGHALALAPMSERIARGEFDVVEVEEGVGTTARSSEDKPPGPLPGPTLEQKLLANRRARRASEPIPYPEAVI